MSETTPSSDSAAVLRGVAATVLRRLGLFLGVLLLAAPLAGHLLAGRPGLWGALLGAGLGVGVAAVTVVVLRIAANRPTHVLSGAVVLSWLAKMILVGAVLIAVRDQDFYSPGVLLGTIVLAVMGPMAIEVQALMAARVPAVSPGAGQPPSRD